MNGCEEASERRSMNERTSEGENEAGRKGKRRAQICTSKRHPATPQQTTPGRPALQPRPAPPAPPSRTSPCACAVSHVTVRLRPRLRPPACCESGLGLRQHQVSCEACTEWARPACVAELALHAGQGAGAAAAAAAGQGAGAGAGPSAAGVRGGRGRLPDVAGARPGDPRASGASLAPWCGRPRPSRG